MKMFEQAAREKYRFDSPKGQLQVEDLWDLPLTSTVGKANLDDIARGLNKQLKSGDDVSFVNVAQKSNPLIQAKFDLVRHIIGVKLAENAAATARTDARAKKQKLLEIIERKQNAEMEGKSLADLMAEINALGD
jgi:hypothetical protein